MIELAIAITIVALLASLAFSTYRDNSDRGRVTQAIADIGMMGARLEQRWLDRHAYPETLDEVFPGALDPWGRPYQYLSLEDVNGKGKARKDHALVPINTHFDLYSLGPDGASVGPLTAKASRDDIIWARDGAFVGPAKDF